MNNYSDRLILFDSLKLFAIFLVLWGHTIQYLLSTEFADEPVYRMIYSFHMPLFMMITGFFFAKTFKSGFINTTLKKFRQLIIPALVWSVLFSVLKTLKTGMPSLDYIIANISNGFWFLKSAFICCLLGYPICKFLNYRVLLGGVIFCFSQTPFDSSLQISFMFPCFYCGMFLQWKYKYVRKMKLSIPLMITGIIAVLGNLALDSELYRLTFDAIYLRPVWQDASVIMLRLFRIILGISVSLFIIFAFEGITRKMLEYTTLNKVIVMLGSETLGIYILQSYLLEYLMARHLNFDNMPFATFNFVVAPAISLIILLISICIIKTLKTNRYFAAILFGSRIQECQKIDFAN